MFDPDLVRENHLHCLLPWFQKSCQLLWFPRSVVMVSEVKYL